MISLQYVTLDLAYPCC